ncbi:MAG: alpha/beta fold hydrolase [Kofleriaceae bacterium]
MPPRELRLDKRRPLLQKRTISSLLEAHLVYPVGYRQLHPNDQLNYQINRWLPGADEGELVEASKVASLLEWETSMLRLADRAAAERRHLHASTYYRAAEFFMGFDRPDKLQVYARYREHIALVDVGVPYERVEVPYRTGKLPAYRFRTDRPRRDTLVIHGGFDSYVEEFLFWGAEYASLGYDVILFEGPGQGGALRDFDLRMDPEWEHPVAAILDHFEVAACTLLGLSLGGYLALRAAAFEPRVKRVIALNVMYDFFECFAIKLGPNAGVALSRRLAAGDEAEIDRAFRQLSNSHPTLAWAVAHGRHISGAASTVDYLRWLERMSTASFSDRLTQDVLLIAGSEDHIVPLAQLHRQAEALTNVRSLTTRLFTAQDHAQAHCQVGNLRLVLDFMQVWMDFQLRQLGH